MYINGRGNATEIGWGIAAIADDKFDLNAIGRPFIANPDYVAKVRENAELITYSDEMLTSLV